MGRLAAGGMAEILLGRMVGPHAFERPVAVKRILPHLASDRAFVDMFVHEARISASIRHARVAQVHELANAGGEYFLVMEYVEGESLGGLMRRLWLRGEALDRVLAAHIVAEACAGLHAAHELTDASGAGREVVHRDVSPQNVMITYAGEIKILDFGIAKAADSTRTQNGQVKGKCEYMSPEQCRGEPLDRRSDIFSLGILLYELTVGKRLFKRDHAMAVFHAVCDDPIPAPAEIDPSYPPALAAICLRALARDRRDRYPTMRDMRRDLVTAIRKMASRDGRSGEEELLGGVMTRLFTDRIAEKRDMLCRARSGSSVDHIPVAEADAQIELPDVPRATAAGLGAYTRSVRATRVRWRRYAALAAATLAAAVLGSSGLWLRQRLTARAPAAIAAPLAPLPSPALTPIALSSRAPLAPRVMVTVESMPPGATVVLADEIRATTPCSLEVARGDAILEVAISRAGFQAVVEHVVPNADQKLVIHLQPTAAAPAAKRAPAPGAAPSSPGALPARKPRAVPKPPEPPVFERFD